MLLQIHGLKINWKCMLHIIANNYPMMVSLSLSHSFPLYLCLFFISLLCYRIHLIYLAYLSFAECALKYNCKKCTVEIDLNCYWGVKLRNNTTTQFFSH